MALSQQLSLHERVVILVEEQQKIIVSQLEELDGKLFRVDHWSRPNGGHGISCVLEDGNVFERGAVNISIIANSTMTSGAASQMRHSHSLAGQHAESLQYSAVGLSLILHPKNPMAPTVHMNCRHFTTLSNGNVDTSWFGGGADLTPCYLFKDDANHFHSTLKAVCDVHDSSYYSRFKQWCDEYFWNAHRNEARGIGGIFFDNLSEGSKGGELDTIFLFVQDFVRAFLPAYMPIIQRRKDSFYTPSQKEWQQIRRGRYVEFNLLHDRGTKFGLGGSDPRVESIFMSLPATAAWKYDFNPQEDSQEHDLVRVLRAPKEWV